DPRSSREAVMDSILSSINLAIDWLPKKGQEATGRINREVALQLKARICLFEGTFRKYHTDLGLSGQRFLAEAVSAAEELINSGKFSVWETGSRENDYHDLFIQDSYQNNP